MNPIPATRSLFPLPADQAAELARDEIAGAFERHRRHLDTLRQWRNQSELSQRAKVTKPIQVPKPEVPAPLALQITTGVGKTRAAAQLAAKADIGLLILVRDHILAEEVHEAVIAAGEQDAMMYRGRTDLREHPAHCREMGMAKELSQQRRLIQPMLCQSCPHGLSTMMQRALSAPEPDQEKILKLNRKAYSREVDLLATEPCSWLDHQKQAIETRIVIAAHPSYGPTLAQWHNGGHEEPRLVVVDESATLAQAFPVQVEHVGQWRRRLDDIRQQGETQMLIQRQAIQALDDADSESDAVEAMQEEIRRLEKEREELAIGEQFLVALAAWMADSVATAGDQQPAELLPPDAVIAAAQAVAEIDTIQDSAAPWEHAIALPFRGEEKVVPMRAAHDLAWAIAHDSAYARNGTLHAIAPTVLGATLARKQAHLLLLDATLPRATRAAVEALGGRVVEIVAAQNIKIVQFPDRAHLRGGWSNPVDGEKRKALEYRRLSLARETLCTEVGEAPGVITHKPLADLMTKVGLPCGYWGRGEVGTDVYNGRHLLVFGDPLPPPASLRAKYEADRSLALAAGASASDWPRWADTERERPEVQVTLETSLRSKIRMPTNQKLLAWVLDYCTGRFHQAVGRVRGARASETLTIHVYAGLPVDWRALGVQVEFRKDSEAMGPGRGKAAGSAAAGLLSHGRAVEKLAEAFARLLSEGKLPSRREAGASPSAFAGQRVEALVKALERLEPAVARRLASTTDRRYAWAAAAAKAVIAG